LHFDPYFDSYDLNQCASDIAQPSVAETWNSV